MLQHFIQSIFKETTHTIWKNMASCQLLCQIQIYLLIFTTTFICIITFHLINPIGSNVFNETNEDVLVKLVILKPIYKRKNWFQSGFKNQWFSFMSFFCFTSRNFKILCYFCIISRAKLCLCLFQMLTGYDYICRHST